MKRPTPAPVPVPAEDVYPAAGPERDDWIVRRRGPRQALDPEQPVTCLAEAEPGPDGVARSVATVFLANRECPWRCVMCDLWQHTLPETVPLGAIPRQIDVALDRLRRNGANVAGFQWLKLYNSGSFFDARAIPPADHPAIAERLGAFERVIVECHPALVNERVAEFKARLPGRVQLEVALGLETADPVALEKINKRMDLPLFESAARFLRARGMAVRTFLLVPPPFVPPSEAEMSVRRSLEVAFAAGAEVVSLIPTRVGNGAMEALQRAGAFHLPRVSHLEAALEDGLALGRGRVFADMWDLERFSDCPACFPARRDRLQAMNRQQQVLPAVRCERCDRSRRTSA